jgi:hypothetical protein
MPDRATRFYSLSLDRALPVERQIGSQRRLKWPGEERGNTPFHAQAVWCILLSSRKIKREIQELFKSLLRALSAMLEVAGSAMPHARYRIFHERGNNANKNYLADCRR